MNATTLHTKLQRTPLPTKAEAIIEHANKVAEAKKRYPHLVDGLVAELDIKLEEFAK